MPRTLLIALAAATLLMGSLLAQNKDKDKKDKASSKPAAVTVVKVDAAKGDITVKFTNVKGKETEKTFHLSTDVRLLDETGRIVKLDVFRSGQDALVLESEGQLRELRRTIKPHPGRQLSDAVKTLIEMSEADPACTAELQHIYDMLRKLDTGKNGKIDPVALSAAREQIVAERIDDLIKRLDTNKDGKISKEEARGLVKEHFEKLDLNKDGFLDRDELLKAAKEKYESKTSQPEKK